MLQMTPDRTRDTLYCRDYFWVTASNTKASRAPIPFVWDHGQTMHTLYLPSALCFRTDIPHIVCHHRSVGTVLSPSLHHHRSVTIILSLSFGYHSSISAKRAPNFASSSSVLYLLLVIAKIAMAWCWPQNLNLIHSSTPPPYPHNGQTNRSVEISQWRTFFWIHFRPNFRE